MDRSMMHVFVELWQKEEKMEFMILIIHSDIREVAHIKLKYMDS